MAVQLSATSAGYFASQAGEARAPKLQSHQAPPTEPREQQGRHTLNAACCGKPACLAKALCLSYIEQMQIETLSVRITASESLALGQRARKDGVSKGSLVRAALRAYGVTPELEAGQSGHEVIQHVLAKVQAKAGQSRTGARDLSTNPKHMAGYGE